MTSERSVRVLLAEDDDEVRETTALVLEQFGFTVTAAADGVEAARLEAEADFDVAVLDVAMPQMDGLVLTRLLRQRGSLPILLLTARDMPGDIVAGLEAGADDHVAKPFDGAVLAARIRALHRRAQPGVPSLTDAGLVINRDARSVSLDGMPVALSATEYDLLLLLLEHRGKVLDRREILHHVWGDDSWIDERVVDTNIKRVRAKVGHERIVTVRGTGYRYDPVDPAT
ncbi:MAG: response regulator transcription factor [Nocardioides sp.]